MKQGHPVTDEEVDDIIARGRDVRRAPDVVRARLLARARTAITAQDRSRTAAPGVAAPSSRGRRRVAVAAAILLALGTAGTAAALYTRAARLAGRAPAPLHAAEPTSAPRAAAPPAETVLPPSAKPARRPHGLMTPQESYAAELALLQRAQAEYAGQDFPDALVLVAEHARRFPHGRLAEEREALRVRSLAGASRGQEARRALALFARRFPHSVLLPRLQEAARTAED